MADALRRTAGVVGELLVTVGVVLLLFVVYELQVTGLQTARAQEELREQVARTWSRTPAGLPVGGAPATGVEDTSSGTVPAEPRAEDGAAWGVVRAPRLGGDWEHVVVQGVGVEDLKRGPGHWPGSAEAGQVGNVVLSGHRTTYGAPFNEVDALRPGDALVLETPSAWHVYRVTGQQVVSPTAVEVAAPVPGRPGEEPVRRLLTLTTCHPEYSAQQRLVISAELEASTAKADGGPPAVLAAGG